MPRSPHNLTGKRFGRLFVIGVDGHRATCRCDCGNYTTRAVRYLCKITFRTTPSCGCFQQEHWQQLHERKRKHNWQLGTTTTKRGKHELGKHERAVEKYLGQRFGDFKVLEVLLPDPPGSARRLLVECTICGQQARKRSCHLNQGAGLFCRHDTKSQTRQETPKWETQTTPLNPQV